jgi:hypothetical protein
MEAFQGQADLPIFKRCEDIEDGDLKPNTTYG